MSGLEVRVLPENSVDKGTQKCRLYPQTMNVLGITVASHVRVTIDDNSYVCTVWPIHSTSEKHAIQFDKSVYSCQKLETDKNSNDLPVCKVEVLSVSKSVSAQITVILKAHDKIGQLRRCPDLRKQLMEDCQRCLRKKCVVSDCIVDLTASRLGRTYGIGRIIVNSLQTKSCTQGGIITENTNLQIESFQSEERYRLSQQTSTSEIAGMSKTLKELEDLLNLPLKHSEDFERIGIQCPKGILLRGPPGCGKTSLVRYFAKRSNSALLVINGPEILSPHPGESEENVRNIFNKALQLSQEGPCILFIDEIDSICPKRGKSGKTNDSRVTSALLSSLDGLSHSRGLVVIGATNRPSALDQAIRRPGRFDREVLINVPDRQQRYEILQMHSKRLPLAKDIDHDLLADLTNGYVGADLASLCCEAAYHAMEGADTKTPCPKQAVVEMADFVWALHQVVPSIQKGAECVVDVTPVKWADIGGLDDIKLQIRQAVEWPIHHGDAFRRLGLPPPRGVLLYGPPGCCKTTLVKAAATATSAAFVSLSGAQLYSPFVGDSERMVSEVFEKSRAMAPTILFLDEIDSIVGKRSEGKSHRGVQERVLSTLLNEMDGVGIRLDTKTDSVTHSVREGEGVAQEHDIQAVKDQVDTKKILVVAATNRPDLVDEAILRPGRIDRIIYVPPPDQQTRHKILKVHCRKMPLCDVSIDIVAEKTDFYTGADLENLCKEAALCALTEDLDSQEVGMRHFMTALRIVKPSLNAQMVDMYRNLGTRYRTS